MVGDRRIGRVSRRPIQVRSIAFLGNSFEVRHRHSPNSTIASGSFLKLKLIAMQVMNSNSIDWRPGVVSIQLVI